MFKRYAIAFAVLIAMTMGAVNTAHAQETAANQVTTKETPVKKAAPKLRKFDADSFPSLLFTYWEQVAIEDARRSRGENRAPTEAELEQAMNTEDNLDMPKPPPEKRNITLSGIAYKAKKNWTIWLNGQRITPKAIPPEVLDLKVFQEYIEVKWYDEYTNRIIPIRLRPHQRFNIDTRIFLPG